jgi:putative SOS response-associated peptidase YedK
MCNHYRNDPVAMTKLPTWREFIGWSLDGTPPEAETDVWPKRRGLVVRSEGSSRIAEAMTWGVPLTVPGKRPGTTITKNVTNVRNLTSPFWRSMLAKPSQRCLVPFTA